MNPAVCRPCAGPSSRNSWDSARHTSTCSFARKRPRPAIPICCWTAIPTRCASLSRIVRRAGPPWWTPSLSAAAGGAPGWPGYPGRAACMSLPPPAFTGPCFTRRTTGRSMRPWRNSRACLSGNCARVWSGMTRGRSRKFRLREPNRPGRKRWTRKRGAGKGQHQGRECSRWRPGRKACVSQRPSGGCFWRQRARRRKPARRC